MSKILAKGLIASWNGASRQLVQKRRALEDISGTRVLLSKNHKGYAS
jgi:hypothetical protein